jgi:hypothetical protein
MIVNEMLDGMIVDGVLRSMITNVMLGGTIVYGM